jgi:CMP-N-acetylneuraminic acid synthetase
VIGGRRILGLIPARSGSKGLPGKNIRDLLGKPLVAWTVEAALKSRYLDRVVVSTDDSKIADIARRFGASVPFLRPSQLASDTATSYDVIDHAVAFLRSTGEEFDYVALLEPTSPLREDNDIDRMIEQIYESGADSVVSVGEAASHPSSTKRLVGQVMEPFCSAVALTNRRQDDEDAYSPYGGIYIAKEVVLAKLRTFYAPGTNWYKVKRYQCYEIDTIYDFVCVESILGMKLSGQEMEKNRA